MPIFEVKFFSNALRNFSTGSTTTFKVFKIIPKIISLRSKKIRVIRHVNQKISTKTRFTSQKKQIFVNFPSDHCSDMRDNYVKNGRARRGPLRGAWPFSGPYYVFRLHCTTSMSNFNFQNLRGFSRTY